MGVLGDGLRLAVGTVTAVPVPPPVLVDRRRAGVAMSVASVAVLPVGVGVGLVVWLGGLLAVPALVTAALAVGVLALGSRAIHLDGLADTADGLTASYNREKALEIMTRGNTGPAGAAALVLVLVVQIAALATVVGRPWAGVVAGGLVMVSRGALLISCVRGIPAARPGGLGATVAGSVPRSTAVVVGMLLGALGCWLAALSGRPWWQGVVAVLVAGLLVSGLVLRCARRLGGITGDVLGASVEVGLLGLLVVAAAG